jgi:hypothetical protein
MSEEQPVMVWAVLRLAGLPELPLVAIREAHSRVQPSVQPQARSLALPRPAMAFSIAAIAISMAAFLKRVAASGLIPTFASP